MTAATFPAIDNLVHQTTTVTGTGNATLTAVNGKQTFDGAFAHAATTDWFYYYITNRDVASEREFGTGHMSDATTLVRDTVLGGSNSTSLVNFSAGTKDVVCDIPASLQGITGLATIASGSTTDLGSVQSNCITISGTVTITSFGSTAPTGALKTVRFSGILTLTHNGTSLIIPGAANVLTASGDMLTARHEGSGNWRVMHFTYGVDTLDWKTWTPTVTSGAGTITTSTVNLAKYWRNGRKIHFIYDITITTVGSGSGALIVTTPVTALTGSVGGGSGRENSITGVFGGAIVNEALGGIFLTKYDGTGAVVASYTWNINGMYIAA